MIGLSNVASLTLDIAKLLCFELPFECHILQRQSSFNQSVPIAMFEFYDKKFPLFLDNLGDICLKVNVANNIPNDCFLTAITMLYYNILSLCNSQLKRSVSLDDVKQCFYLLVTFANDKSLLNSTKNINLHLKFASVKEKIMEISKSSHVQ